MRRREAVPRRNAAERANIEGVQATSKTKDSPKKARRKLQAKVIADNRKARHEYEILESLECGIVLRGSEVKSLRAGKVSLEEAYGRVKQGEVFLVGCDIQEYVFANRFNHDPRRPRKLLMHRRELRKFAGKAYEQGLTLVPLKLYFNEEGRVKVSLAVCRGRKLHDKREVMKKADAQREIARAARRN